MSDVVIQGSILNPSIVVFDVEAEPEVMITRYAVINPDDNRCFAVVNEPELALDFVKFLVKEYENKDSYVYKTCSPQED